MTALVEQSLSSARWVVQDSTFSDDETERRATGISQASKMPLSLCRFIARRGITSQTLDNFLEPRLRDILPDPFVLKDAEAAITLICDYIERKQPIGLFGDYDVDGACSAALFSLCLGQYGVPVYCHIPDRFSEGYGPNEAALTSLSQQGAELLITVDCGITAHAPLLAASDAGLPVIVVDHHKAGPSLPKAKSVVNPNRLDDDSGLGYLCAAGVSFLVLAGVVRECRNRGIEPLSGQPVNMLNYLDLVALATICDVMPLISVNRAFVRQGLKVMAQRRNIGIKTLMDVARVDHIPSVYTLGFMLGPRINAGGRLGQSSIGVQLLCAPDADIAATLAWRLDELNTQRKSIESDIRQQAEDQAYALLQDNPDRAVLVVSGTGWNEGVIGIVAGRLKEKFNKVSVVISFDEAGTGKGSGRSLAGFSLGNAVLAGYQKELLVSGGGHDMAAGLGIEKDKLDAFYQYLETEAQAHFTAQGIPQKEHIVGADITVGGINIGLVGWLDDIGPFGVEFAEPRFRITHCRLKNLRWIGAEKQHLSVSIDDSTAPPLRAIMFHCADTPLGQTLKQQGVEGVFQLVGRVQKDSYRGGDAVQFMIEDIAVQPAF